jgi:hypothetical protein
MTTQQISTYRVYVTAIWWTDSDPFVRIVGNDRLAVRNAAMRAMADAASEAADETDDEDAMMDRLHWNGVGTMNLSDVIAAWEVPSLEPEYSDLLSGDKDALVYVS